MKKNILIFLLALTLSTPIQAQDPVFDPTTTEATPTPTAAELAPPQFAEGVSGSLDKKNRAPVIAVNPVVEATQVKILVDAHIPNKEYQKFPIQFDFYVNRKLVSTQIRSVELPGPIALIVSSDIAVPPFNYTITATLLDTNRQFVSVANGAVYATNLAGTFSCTLTESSGVISTDTESSSSSNTFTIDSTYLRQTTPSGISFEFTATGESTDPNEDVTREIKGSLEITSSSSTASGKLVVDKNPEFSVSGESSSDSENKLSGFNVNSTSTTSSQSYSLSCDNVSSDGSSNTEEAVSSSEANLIQEDTGDNSNIIFLDDPRLAGDPNISEYKKKITPSSKSNLEKAADKLFGGK